jgi:hypothetical protein
MELKEVAAMVTVVVMEPGTVAVPLAFRLAAAATEALVLVVVVGAAVAAALGKLHLEAQASWIPLKWLH